jgi:hypothetical protein
MNQYQDLAKIPDNHKALVIQGLYENIFNGVVNQDNQDLINNAWPMLRMFYDFTILKDMVITSELLDPYSTGDVMDAHREVLINAITGFYDLNPGLLTDNFSLNDNWYDVDLRCLIVDLEDSLRQEKEGQ